MTCRMDLGAIADGAARRARATTATLAGAESLADLLRDHGFPARVIVGRKRGTLAIRTAVPGTRGRSVIRIPATRDAVMALLAR